MKTLQSPTEDCKNYAIHFLKSRILNTRNSGSPLKLQRYKAEESKSDRGKKCQIGRERPHFFGLQPPKKFVGSLPPTSEGPDEPHVASYIDAPKDNARHSKADLSHGKVVTEIPQKKNSREARNVSLRDSTTFLAIGNSRGNSRLNPDPSGINRRQNRSPQFREPPPTFPSLPPV